ncbi:hypothetical protein INT47_001677 [Mucor saturninus]|uniref:Uncharacterized protein n=1 Tax=Mucor saturninus TaxID=64648 RepID=A0A8H7VB65_9FUNG|nr:hypothetical protein INT47_001677 [Mucor saturninus]
MQQELYPNQQEPLRRFQICGCMDMSYAGPLVCFLWMIINMYACVLSFQDRSPVYSHLNHASLVVQGVVCLFFVISALISLYSFTLNMPNQLRRSHRSTWFFVILFLIVYFVNMIIFGVQKIEFKEWCVSKSQLETVKTLTINNNTVHTIAGFDATNVSGLVFIPTNKTMDAYNCSRLWEDEMKFSVVIFVILFTLYIHFAFCFWYYTQDVMGKHEQMYEAFHNQQQGFINSNLMNNPMMMNNPNLMIPTNQPMMMPTNQTGIMPTNQPMMNNNPSSMKNSINPMYSNEEKQYDDDGQKSLAQLARAAFGRLR